MHVRPRQVPLAILAVLAVAGAGQATTAELAGRAVIADPLHPPPWIEVHPAARRDFDLGLAVFNTQWQPAGDASVGDRVGLGPLFIQPSCASCHRNGGRGEPAADGGLSPSFVMQLGGPETTYGHVLNTRAVAGHVPEGRVTVTWRQRRGTYGDGTRWTLREPDYALQDLAAGPLPAATVLRPRIGPALFGAGLLDAVSQATLEEIRRDQPRAQRGTPGGRFGWQGDAMSLIDQTALAFSREMGLTSELEPRDDCTPAQLACRRESSAGEPEVPERLFHALGTFQFLLAAPARGAAPGGATDADGATLFENIGCAVCHVPHLTVMREDGEILIDPYSDLLLHDMGSRLADRTVGGRMAQGRWRTAPLWGLSEALRAGPVALLHDGRAASIEEAILWHGGQGSDARRRFIALDAPLRRQLLDWLATL